jgi:hypothetical protein
MRPNNVRNGASQGLVFQVQPQTTTNAGGDKTFIIPGSNGRIFDCNVVDLIY